MKYLYNLLFVSAVLLSGNIYGMEKVKMAIVKFEDHRDIMDRVYSANLIDGFDFNTLQDNLDTLNTIVQNVADKKLNAEKATTDEIDTLLAWLLVFDSTNHEYETLIADALDVAIKTHGLTSAMRPWEHSLVQKGDHLQGLGKKYVDGLRDKERNDKNQLRRPLTDVEKVKKARDAIKTLRTIDNKSFKDQLGLLSIDCLSDINDLVKKMIKNDQALLNIWNDKFHFLETQYVVEEEQLWQEEKENAEQQLEQQRQRERQVAEQRRQAQEQERQRLDQLAQEQLQIEEQRRQQQQVVEEQQHQAEEQRQQQIQQQRALEENLRQVEEQRSQQQTADERRKEQRQQRQLLEQEQRRQAEEQQMPQKPKVELPQPDIDGGPAAGVAALLGYSSVPKLAVAAVVVGVCYWGYTKYKARKAAQSDFAKASTDRKENNDQAVDNTQNVQKKKESVRSKQRVR